MRILVTGSTGFLGRRLTPRLQQGVEDRYSGVLCWSRALHGDLLSRDNRARVLDSLGPDIVVHLAWLKTGTADYEHAQQNFMWAQSTVAFSQEVIQRESRFIGIGSMAENDPSISTNYALAKRSAAAGVLALQTRRRLSAWLRPSWIFDFAEPRPRVLRLYAEAQAQGLPFIPDNPQSLRNFIHVEDVARAVQQAIDYGWTGQWDVTARRVLSVGELLNCYDEWRRMQASKETSQPSDNDTRSDFANRRNVLECSDWQATESDRLLGHGTSVISDGGLDSPDDLGETCEL
jgi:nucleoside-diphosphate-sugar epimerase